MNIDLNALPADALIDTNVLIRFLGERQDANTAACKAFCDAMINEGRQLWIAAPTIAEVCRQRGVPVPRYKGIAVVPFDDRAAELLGVKMPMAKLHETKAQNGLSLTYLKYDAMIVACALRARTATIVAIDGDHVVLAQGLPIDVRRPEFYYGKSQLPVQLPLLPAANAQPDAGPGAAVIVAAARAAPVEAAEAAAKLPPIEEAISVSISSPIPPSATASPSKTPAPLAPPTRSDGDPSEGPLPTGAAPAVVALPPEPPTGPVNRPA